ncbi:hypothetical protein C8T65DRAFT_79660 [Cerioporus squamosus]|nr:hypothetical protein C8T65DRAFT_79660 [Cerioporus squamosus]
MRTPTVGVLGAAVMVHSRRIQRSDRRPVFHDYTISVPADTSLALQQLVTTPTLHRDPVALRLARHLQNGAEFKTNIYQMSRVHNGTRASSLGF